MLGAYENTFSNLLYCSQDGGNANWCCDDWTNPDSCCSDSSVPRFAQNDLGEYWFYPDNSGHSFTTTIISMRTTTTTSVPPRKTVVCSATDSSNAKATGNLFCESLSLAQSRSSDSLARKVGAGVAVPLCLIAIGLFTLYWHERRKTTRLNRQVEMEDRRGPQNPGGLPGWF